MPARSHNGVVSFDDLHCVDDPACFRVLIPLPERLGARWTVAMTSRKLELPASAFDLSLHTVRRHVANILGKIGAESRGQAAAWYRDQGSRRQSAARNGKDHDDHRPPPE